MNILESSSKSRASHLIALRPFAVVALALLCSASAYARPLVRTTPVSDRAVPDRGRWLDRYVENFRKIAADDEFRANYRHWRQRYPNYDWNSNGCGEPASGTGYANEFYWACVQHDFGYRNNRLVDVHDERTRLFIDKALAIHLRQICAARSGPDRARCDVVGRTFYATMRIWGRFAF